MPVFYPSCLFPDASILPILSIPDVCILPILSIPWWISVFYSQVHALHAWHLYSTNRFALWTAHGCLGRECAMSAALPSTVLYMSQLWRWQPLLWTVTRWGYLPLPPSSSIWLCLLVSVRNTLATVTHSAQLSVCALVSLLINFGKGMRDIEPFDCYKRLFLLCCWS